MVRAAAAGTAWRYPDMLDQVTKYVGWATRGKTLWWGGAILLPGEEVCGASCVFPGPVGHASHAQCGQPLISGPDTVGYEYEQSR